MHLFITNTTMQEFKRQNGREVSTAAEDRSPLATEYRRYREIEKQLDDARAAQAAAKQECEAADY
jgi:hypothetical protein